MKRSGRYSVSQTAIPFASADEQIGQPAAFLGREAAPQIGGNLLQCAAFLHDLRRILRRLF